LTLSPTRPYAPGVHGPQDDEGSFAAGRQSLLDALQSLEQRAHERAERMIREAERTARQLTLDSEQRAYQLTSEAEERARQTLIEAEQRAKQATLDTAQRLAELEQQLSEVRDNLEAARAQIEEQVVSVRGQVEVARASLNTVRQQLTSSSARVPEPQVRINPVPRPSIPRLSPEPAFQPQPRVEEAAGPSLSDLRAAVDALKKPRREVVVEPATNSDEPATIDETSDAARR
jgi:multidrug efflux pump subunit AcrA (membrane-fusion protein)